MGRDPTPTTTRSATSCSPESVTTVKPSVRLFGGALQLRSETDVHAVTFVRGVNDGAGLLVAHPGEDPLLDLEHRRAHAELARRRRHLEPDQPSADDDHLAPRGQLRLQTVRVSLGPQVVNAGRTNREMRQLAGFGARRQHQRVVGQTPAAAQHDGARLRSMASQCAWHSSTTS